MLRAIVITSSMLVLSSVASAHERTLFQAGGGVAAGKQAEPGDRGKIVDRLHSKYQDVLDQLNKNDPGADTLALQKEIAELLKRLLEQDDPPDQTGNPPPSSPPSSAKDSPPAPKPTPMNLPQDAANIPQPEPKNSPTTAAPKPQPIPAESDRPAKSFEELKKQLQDEGRWPLKLPPHHRDNIDVSGHGRFMPRYEDLLRAYYRTIAESSRGKREE